MPATAYSGRREAPRSSTSIAFIYKDLTSVLARLYSAVRTPFTCLLDAAEPVWVLGCPVTSRGHRQTGERYHRGHECGNSYTHVSASSRLDRRTDYAELLEQSFEAPTELIVAIVHAWFALCVRSDPPSGPVRRLRQEICTVCCATKRLVEIQCTEDCRYLDCRTTAPGGRREAPDRSRCDGADGDASAGSRNSSCSSSFCCSRWCCRPSPRG